MEVFQELNRLSVACVMRVAYYAHWEVALAILREDRTRSLDVNLELVSRMVASYFTDIMHLTKIDPHTEKAFRKYVNKVLEADSVRHAFSARRSTRPVYLPVLVVNHAVHTKDVWILRIAAIMCSNRDINDAIDTAFSHRDGPCARTLLENCHVPALKLNPRWSYLAKYNRWDTVARLLSLGKNLRDGPCARTLLEDCHVPALKLSPRWSYLAKYNRWGTVAQLFLLANDFRRRDQLSANFSQFPVENHVLPQLCTTLPCELIADVGYKADWEVAMAIAWLKPDLHYLQFEASYVMHALHRFVTCDAIQNHGQHVYLPSKKIFKTFIETATQFGFENNMYHPLPADIIEFVTEVSKQNMWTLEAVVCVCVQSDIEKVLSMAVRARQEQVVQVLLKSHRVTVFEDDMELVQIAEDLRWTGVLDELEWYLTSRSAESIREMAAQAYARSWVKFTDLCLRHGAGPLSAMAMTVPDRASHDNRFILQASLKGCTTVVRELMGTVEVVVLDRCLGVATSYRDLRTVKALLESPHVTRHLALREACRLGACDIIEYLLASCRVDPTHNRNEALMRACEEGKVEAIKLLCADRRVSRMLLSMEVEDPHTDRPLFYRALCASAQKSLAAVEYIMSLKPEGVTLAPNEMAEALDTATFEGNDAIVEFFMQYNVNAERALYTACVEGKASVARVLLEGGKYDSYEQRSEMLVRAVRRGHEGVVRVLLDATDPSLFGDSRVYVAVLEDTHIQELQRLLKKWAYIYGIPIDRLLGRHPRGPVYTRAVQVALRAFNRDERNNRLVQQRTTQPREATGSAVDTLMRDVIDGTLVVSVDQPMLTAPTPVDRRTRSLSGVHSALTDPLSRDASPVSPASSDFFGIPNRHLRTGMTSSSERALRYPVSAIHPSSQAFREGVPGGDIFSPRTRQRYPNGNVSAAAHGPSAHTSARRLHSLTAQLPASANLSRAVDSTGYSPYLGDFLRVHTVPRNVASTTTTTTPRTAVNPWTVIAPPTTTAPPSNPLQSQAARALPDASNHLRGQDRAHATADTLRSSDVMRHHHRPASNHTVAIHHRPANGPTVGDPHRPVSNYTVAAQTFRSASRVCRHALANARRRSSPTNAGGEPVEHQWVQKILRTERVLQASCRRDEHTEATETSRQELKRGYMQWRVAEHAKRTQDASEQRAEGAEANEISADEMAEIEYNCVLTVISDLINDPAHPCESEEWQTRRVVSNMSHRMANEMARAHLRRAARDNPSNPHINHEQLPRGARHSRFGGFSLRAGYESYADALAREAHAQIGRSNGFGVGISSTDASASSTTPANRTARAGGVPRGVRVISLHSADQSQRTLTTSANGITNEAIHATQTTLADDTANDFAPLSQTTSANVTTNDAILSSQTSANGTTNGGLLQTQTTPANSTTNHATPNALQNGAIRRPSLLETARNMRMFRHRQIHHPPGQISAQTPPQTQPQANAQFARDREDARQRAAERRRERQRSHNDRQVRRLNAQFKIIKDLLDEHLGVHKNASPSFLDNLTADGNYRLPVESNTPTEGDKRANEASGSGNRTNEASCSGDRTNEASSSGNTTNEASSSGNGTNEASSSGNGTNEANSRWESVEGPLGSTDVLVSTIVPNRIDTHIANLELWAEGVLHADDDSDSLQTSANPMW